jgi:hypothetical protein
MQSAVFTTFHCYIEPFFVNIGTGLFAMCFPDKFHHSATAALPSATAPTEDQLLNQRFITRLTAVLVTSLGIGEYLIMKYCNDHVHDDPISERVINNVVKTFVTTLAIGDVLHIGSAMYGTYNKYCLMKKSKKRDQPWIRIFGLLGMQMSASTAILAFRMYYLNKW